jgi:hypothetical protein
MADMPDDTNLPRNNPSALSYALTAIWIAIRLVAVIILLRQGGTFFYQGF